MADIEDCIPPGQAAQPGFDGPFYDACHSALALEAGSRILEVGVGAGHHVPGLLARARDIHYTGLDISPAMVAEAARLNADLVAGGRVTFQCGNPAAMDFASGRFDRAIALNVIDLWPDPVAPLAAIHRALRPNGICVIGAADPVSQTGAHPHSADAMVLAHRQAGFKSITVAEIEDTVPGHDGAPVRRRFNIVAAKA